MSKYGCRLIAALGSMLGLYAFATLPVVKLPDVRGTYEATVFVLSLPQSEVRALLPAGLELGAQNSTGAEKHPVLVILGKQKRVRNVVGRTTLPYEFNYTETVLAVPYTRLSAGTLPRAKYRGPFYFMPKIFLDNRVPQFLGYAYGYNKVIAKLVADTGTYLISRGAQSLLNASFVSQAAFASPERFPKYAEVERMMKQPIIGKRPDGFVCSAFDWNPENNLRIQPVSGTLQILVPLMNGSVGPLFYKSRSIKDARLGSFNVNSAWGLRGPFSCADLSR